jgi:hypothetical protein
MRPGRYVLRERHFDRSGEDSRVAAFPGTTTLDQLAAWLGGEGCVALMRDTSGERRIPVDRPVTDRDQAKR